MIFFREDVTHIVIKSVQEKVIIVNVTLRQVSCFLAVILLKSQTEIQSSVSHRKAIVQHGLVMTDVLMNDREVIVLFKTAFGSNAQAVTVICNRKMLQEFTGSAVACAFNDSHVQLKGRKNKMAESPFTVDADQCFCIAFRVG